MVGFSIDKLLKLFRESRSDSVMSESVYEFSNLSGAFFGRTLDLLELLARASKVLN